MVVNRRKAAKWLLLCTAAWEDVFSVITPLTDRDVQLYSRQANFSVFRTFKYAL